MEASMSAYAGAAFLSTLDFLLPMGRTAEVAATGPSFLVLVIESEADGVPLLATINLCEAKHEGEVIVTILMLVHDEGIEHLANA
jgi:hypothetical protein